MKEKIKVCVIHMDKLKIYLEKIASKTTATEQEEEGYFCSADAFGGNLDDAYYGGMSDGRINLARELLKKYLEE